MITLQENPFIEILGIFSEPFTIVELAEFDFVAFFADSDEEPQPAKDNTKAIRQIIAEALKALYLS